MREHGDQQSAVETNRVRLRRRLRWHASLVVEFDDPSTISIHSRYIKRLSPLLKPVLTFVIEVEFS